MTVSGNDDKTPDGSSKHLNAVFRMGVYLGLIAAIAGTVLAFYKTKDYDLISKILFLGGAAFSLSSILIFMKIRFAKFNLYTKSIILLILGIEKSILFPIIRLIRLGLKRPVPLVLPSFVTHVARHTAAPKMLLAGGAVLVGWGGAIFNDSRNLLFSYIFFGIAAMWFIDGLLIFIRKENGSYGNNDLEVREVAKYIISKMESGGGPDNFNRVTDPRRTTLEKEAAFGVGEVTQ